MATNKYDRRHRNNLSAYEREIDKLYSKAITQAVAIGLSLPDFKPDTLFSFDDYPAIRKRIEKLLQKFQDGLSLIILNGIKSEWTLANNKNSELARQVFGDNVGKLTQAQYRRYFSSNDSAREAFEKRKVNGLNLSDRVWRYTDQFKAEIELGLDVGIRNGLSADDMSQELRQYLEYPDKLFRRVRDEHGELQLSKRAAAYHPGRGVYRSSYKNARRLAATETNMAYMTADYERWQQLDFVVGIRIELSNNHTLNGKKFRDICDELSAPLGSTNTEGKGCYPKDFKFSGWHPLCRCHVITILKTDEEIAEDTRRILAGEPLDDRSVNRVTDVPQEFKDWVDNNADRIAHAKSIPYFIRDNRTYVMKALDASRNMNINIIGTSKTVMTASLEDIKDAYRVRIDNEADYTNGIASQFDYIRVKQGLQKITEAHGITLDLFRTKISGADRFYVDFDGDGFTLSRTFTRRKDGLEVHHDYFVLDEKHQGKGISKDVFRLLYEQYRSMGVRYITVDANIDVGGYTWARYGFSAKKMDEALNAVRNCKSGELVSKAESFIKNWYKKNSLVNTVPFPMRLLAEQTWGKDLLKGSYWEGVIDLSDNEARRYFEKYIGIK